jgi:hypothetical protein
MVLKDRARDGLAQEIRRQQPMDEVVHGLVIKVLGEEWQDVRSAEEGVDVRQVLPHQDRRILHQEFLRELDPRFAWEARRVVVMQKARSGRKDEGFKEGGFGRVGGHQAVHDEASVCLPLDGVEQLEAGFKVDVAHVADLQEQERHFELERIRLPQHLSFREGRRLLEVDVPRQVDMFAALERLDGSLRYVEVHLVEAREGVQGILDQRDGAEWQQSLVQPRKVNFRLHRLRAARTRC